MSKLSGLARKLIFSAALAAGAGLVAVVYWPKPPAPVRFADQVPVKKGPSHVREADKPAEVNTRGRVTITIRDTIKPTDKPGDVKTIKVVVDIPKDPEAPPTVIVPGKDSSNSGVFIEPVYEDFRDPFFKLRVNILAGASADFLAGPSPYAGISVLTISERFRIGAGVDRFSVGPFAAFEFWREFNAGIKYNAIQYAGPPGDFSFIIAYRF